ncbi:MAG: transcription elongation factor Spt5 [Nanoarchaeota archaeon]
MENKLFAVRTTANREEQVVDFIESNVRKKNLEVYTIVNAHGMRGYIFLEAKNADDAAQACFGIPYSRGLLPKEVSYAEIEPMLEQIKAPINIQDKDIVEIIHGPFKKEKAKVKRIDETKEEVVVELLEAAIPIPITVKMDWVKVIRREGDESIQDNDDD